MAKPSNFTTVKSYEQLCSLIAQIQNENPKTEFVFRGQTENYPSLDSSFSRLMRIEPAKIATHAYKRLCAISSALHFLSQKELLLRFEEVSRLLSLSNWILAEAIVQHYGYRSNYIDVSHSMEVALWFAFHKFNSLGEVVQVCDSELRVTQPAWYQPNEKPGYLLIAKPNKWDSNRTLKPGHLIDLLPLAPPGISRIQRQQAAVLYAPFNSNYELGLTDLIYAKFRLDFSWNETGLDWSTNHIFPEPDKDEIFRNFVTAPFFKTRYPGDNREFPLVTNGPSDNEIEAFKFSIEDTRPLFRRSLTIPEYLEDCLNLKQLAKFRNFDKTLEPTFYLKSLVGNESKILFKSENDKVIEELDQKGQLVDSFCRAFPVLLTRPYILFSMQKGTPVNQRLKKIDIPQLLRNFMLEYGPETYAHPWSEKWMMRGIWFRSDGSENIEIRFLGTSNRQPLVSKPLYYTWTDKDGYTIENGENDWQHFNFLIEFIHWLNTDAIILTDPHSSPNGYSEVIGGSNFYRILERKTWQ